MEANTENIALSVPVPGWVTAVEAHAGDRVEAGQPLFRLDDRDLQAELGVRRAALEAARAHVPTAAADLADAELLRANAARLDRERVISGEEGRRKAIAADAARARLGEAHAAVTLAQAQVRQTEVNLERLVVRAPLAATVLQSDVRPGQFAPSGPLPRPLMLLGNVEPLHVRVDVDEQDAGRVRAGAPAVASPRGDAPRRLRLAFVRFEPYILPKGSLTGSSTERTDTRVLQAIYRVEPPPAGSPPPPFVGQQVDVFIGPGEWASSVASATSGRKRHAEGESLVPNAPPRCPRPTHLLFEAHPGLAWSGSDVHFTVILRTAAASPPSTAAAGCSAACRRPARGS